MRETSSLWTFKLDKNQEKPYKLTVLEGVPENPENVKAA
jgi:hypothetical protein